jgi:porphobilinogen synthase
MVQETRLHPAHFVTPLFLLEGKGRKEAIPSMPGIERMSLDFALKFVEDCQRYGIQSFALFPVIPEEQKDPFGKASLDPNGIVPKALSLFKKEFPEISLFVDVALDPYTDHGHDGLVDSRGVVLNDETVEVLCKMSLIFAQAGADVLAPSDMMDGRIGAIRKALDRDGMTEISLLAYGAKYASSFYGPFRQALGSGLKKGDKKGYQMNPANVREAVLECQLDEIEGADMLLIKPAGPYLDVIAKVREVTSLPIGAYHVSGEYAMVMAAAERGWLNPYNVFEETFLAIKRAGADFIFSYAAPYVAKNLRL